MTARPLPDQKTAVTVVFVLAVFMVIMDTSIVTAGGMMTPVGMTMMYRVFPPAERARASGVVTATATLAPATGPLLGGLLAQSLGWRWVFLVNLPAGLAALGYGTFFLRDVPASGGGRFDLRGFVLSGTGFAAVTYGIAAGPDLGWDSPVIITALAVGCVLIAALVAIQLRVTEPLLNLRLLGDRLFRSMTVTMALTMAAFLGLLFITTLFLQDGLGLSPVSSGVRTFPEALGVMAGSPLAARVATQRAGPRRITAIALTAVGALTASLTAISDRSGLWALSAVLFLIGIAIAHVFVTARRPPSPGYRCARPGAHRRSSPRCASSPSRPSSPWWRRPPRPSTTTTRPARPRTRRRTEARSPAASHPGPIAGGEVVWDPAMAPRAPRRGGPPLCGYPMTGTTVVSRDVFTNAVVKI